MIQDIKNFLKFRDRVDALLRSQSLQTLTNSYLLANHADLVNELEKWFKRLCPSLTFRTGCASCFSDHFVHLKYLSINQIIEKMNVTHKIKEDRVVQFEGEFYSNKSPHLTNEICEKLYHRFGADLFEFYDADWRKKEVTVGQVHREINKDSLSELFEIAPVVDNEEVLAEVEEVEEVVDFSGYSYKDLQKLYKEKTGKSPVKLSKTKLIEELS